MYTHVNLMEVHHEPFEVTSKQFDPMAFEAFDNTPNKMFGSRDERTPAVVDETAWTLLGPFWFWFEVCRKLGATFVTSLKSHW